MKRAFVFLFPVLLLVMQPSLADAPAVGAPAGGGTMPSLAPMVAKVSPAVVNISTYARVRMVQSPLLNDPFFRRFFNLPPDNPQQQNNARQPRAVSAGSGVIVNAGKGYVLTNAHVVKDAEEIKVTLKDGRSFKATLVGQDPQVDLAVLKIDADRLTQATIADSSKLQVGDYVVAIGNPFALGQTVTSGIVSALGRAGLGIEGYENFIQTDASINPGNSGGALVNLAGELVGVPTAILAPTGGNIGIGFAIPASMAVNVMNQLINHGKVSRGMLGVNIQDLTPDLAQAFGISDTVDGVVVTQVMENSAASAAGLKSGDVITAVDGKQVSSAAHLRSIIGLTPVGTRVKLSLLRDGKAKEVAATIRELKQDGAGTSLSPFLEGASLRDLRADEAGQGNRGVLIEQVQDGSPAAQAGLQAGDLILSANHKPVNNLKDLAGAVGSKDQSLLLRINRNGGIFFLVLR